VSPIVGRDAELALIRQFVSDAREGPVALSIRGPAGIGKSTLWQTAVDAGRQAGFHIVSARPSEAEGQLPFASLNDLLGGILDAIDPDLPPPQRLALDVAMLRAPNPSPGRLEPLAISLGALGLLREATAAGPLLLAVDDVQWVDEASASVLEFVVRRLEREAIGVVVARRATGWAAEEASILRGVQPDRRRDIEVAPLPPREIARLLASAIGLEVPPSTVARIHGLAAGNVLHALEIGRAMQRRGLSELEGGHGIPPSLSGLLRDRLAGLSSAGSDVIEHASALSDPRISTLVTVLGREATTRGVDDAGAAHVVVATGDLLRFTHPLLAAEAYARMSEEARREVHLRLATVVTEVEQRATHLDLSSSGADEHVAAALDAAATRADERGAPEAAADYAERASRRTADDGLRLVARRLAAGSYSFRAGDLRRARAWLEAALTEAPGGALRARILVELGRVRLMGDDWEAARELLDTAIGEAGADVRLRIEALLRRAGINFIGLEDRERGAALVEEAMALAESLGDPRLIARVIGPYAMWQWALRRPGLDDLERRAEALGDAGNHLPVRDHFEVEFGYVNAARGRHDRARALLARQLARAEERGDYSSIPTLLVGMTRADFYAGRSDDALTRLSEADRLARVTGQEAVLSGTLSEIVIVSARTGRADAAWRAARELETLVAHLDRARIPSRQLEELATLELSRRDYQAALDALPPVAQFAGDTETVDTTLPTRAEALIGLGRLDEAAEALERYARMAGGRPVFGHDTADFDAGAGRAAAQLAAARGDLDQATQSIGEAMAAYAEDNDQWSRARALLVAADVHRRARRRSQAREAAAEALALFKYFGAALWAERARELVERIGLASQPRADGLTPTQAQVAELAAAGLTNRQIANRLFMSPHTVEAHLSAAYRTLGIRSRRELIAVERDASPRLSDPAPVEPTKHPKPGV
jgi:DNA-binding CsgD family transcriptional regulator